MANESSVIWCLLCIMEAVFERHMALNNKFRPCLALSTTITQGLWVAQTPLNHASRTRRDLVFRQVHLLQRTCHANSSTQSILALTPPSSNGLKAMTPRFVSSFQVIDKLTDQFTRIGPASVPVLPLTYVSIIDPSLTNSGRPFRQTNM